MGLGEGELITNGAGSKSPGSVGKGGSRVKGLDWQAGDDVKVVGLESLNDWVGSRYFLAVKGIFFVEQVTRKGSSWGIREIEEYQNQT